MLLISYVTVSLPSGHSQCHCTHIWHTVLNKYDFHITYTSYTANMLMGIWTQKFYTYVSNHNQLQYTLVMLLPNISLGTSMATKLGMYDIHAKYLVDIYGRCIYMYVQHTMLLQPTMQQGTLYTYLYFNAQIWLPHCTWMFHCTVVYIQTPY